MIHSDTKHTLVIAEAGVNHNGRLDLAFDLIDAAASAGADAVKFQTFDAKRLVGASAPKAAYQKDNAPDSETQLEMLMRLELPLEWHQQLKARAEDRGISFISTAFDDTSLEFLIDLGVPFLKIPSGDLINGPLLWKSAHTGKPLVVSTGMATLSDVELGLAVIAHALSAEREPASLSEVWRAWSDASRREVLQRHVTLLHCTSQYPTPIAEADIRAMDTLRKAFMLDVGYSDHTEGTLMPLVAVARGARVIEKHFTIDRNLPGPDHSASLEPNELEAMVRDIRSVELGLGQALKAPRPNEWDTQQAARQQVAAARDLPGGHLLTREDLTTARLGSGRPPVELWDLVGRRTIRAYQAGEAVFD